MTALQATATRSHARLVDDVLAGCRILDAEELTDAFGHLSCRTAEDEILLSARVGPGLVREPAQVVRLTLQGEVLEGDPSLVPGEAALHLGVMRARPDVASVCRFHGPACFAWSSLAVPLPATTGLALMLGAEIPVHDAASTISTDEAAARCAQTLGGGRAVLLRGFGAVTVGASVAESVVAATFLERAAAAVLMARAVGEPRTYSREQARAFALRTTVIAEQVDRAWTYLCDASSPAQERDAATMPQSDRAER
jgi:ribulose-5-phosphate 4-epimerase/fuculose-1-phosphate aldolase